MKWLRQYVLLLFLLFSFRCYSQIRPQINDIKVGPIIMSAGVGFLVVGYTTPKSYSLNSSGQYYYTPYAFGSRSLGIATGFTLCFVGVFQTIRERKTIRN